MLKWFGGIVSGHSSPEISLREGHKVKGRHYSKVVGAPLQRSEEVRVRLVVGLYDRAVAKDDLLSSATSTKYQPVKSHLEVLHTVTHESGSSSEE